MKQIKPTIIYNETQWTPIVPLNYKTQITNTQWAVLSINPQPRNSDSDREKKKKKNKITKKKSTKIFKHAYAYKNLPRHYLLSAQLEGFIIHLTLSF